MVMKKRSRLLLANSFACASLLLVAGTGPAWAEETNISPDDGVSDPAWAEETNTRLNEGVTGSAQAEETNTRPDDGIEEIIVTAQKRVERLVDVPLTVSAVSGDTIEGAFYNNIESLPRFVPRLTFRKGNTTRNSALFLRGIGTISFSIAAEPSVSTVIDGVVYARSGQAFADFFDLERVEVLPGPQGTLYGKNASAGVINMTTRRPMDQFEAEVVTSAFEDQEYRMRASVSGPVTDDLRARVTGYFGKFDGYIRNVYLDEDVNGYSRRGIRAVVDWIPIEDLSLTLIGDFAQANDDCCAELLGAGPRDPTTGAGAALTKALGEEALPRGDRSRTVNQNLRSKTLDETSGVSLQADLNLFEHTLTSITAYREWDNTEIRDGDFLSGGASYVGLFEQHDTGVQEFSQELRIASPTDQLVEYQAGLFLFHVKADRSFTRNDITCADSAVTEDETGVQPCSEGQSTFEYPSATATFGSEFNNYALFGHATLNIADDLRLVGGVRGTRDEVSFFHSRVNNSGGIGGPGVKPDNFPTPEMGKGSRFTGTNRDWGFMGKATLQYDLHRDVNAYVHWARGYKGPAFNVFFNFEAQDGRPIAAETSNAYEGGVKGSLLDGKLYFGANAFLQKFDNFQANTFVELEGMYITTLANAGKVSTRGFEAELMTHPTSDLSLRGGFAYAKAQIDAFRVLRGAPADVDNRADEELPLSPDWKLAVSGEYRLPIETLPFNTHLSSQYSWQSSQFSDFGEEQELKIGAYGLWNASLSLVSKDDALAFTFLVRNILDESFATLISKGGPGSSFRYLIPREAHRFVGASLRARL